METLEIRGARPGDESFIQELSRQVFSEYTPRAGTKTLAMSGERGAQTLLALRGSRRVGFAVVVSGGGRAHLDAIAVAEPERGRGVGKLLLRRAEAEAARAGARSLTLVTADSNLAALDLFLRSGYRVTARHADFYPRGQSALRLEKAVKA